MTDPAPALDPRQQLAIVFHREHCANDCTKPERRDYRAADAVIDAVRGAVTTTDVVRQLTDRLRQLTDRLVGVPVLDSSGRQLGTVAAVTETGVTMKDTAGQVTIEVHGHPIPDTTRQLLEGTWTL